MKRMVKLISLTSNPKIKLINIIYKFIRRRIILSPNINDFQNGFRFRRRYIKKVKAKPLKRAYKGSTSFTIHISGKITRINNGIIIRKCFSTKYRIVRFSNSKLNQPRKISESLIDTFFRSLKYKNLFSKFD